METRISKYEYACKLLVERIGQFNGSEFKVAIYFATAVFGDPVGGPVFYTYRELAEATGLSERTARMACLKLEVMRVIQSRPTKHRGVLEYAMRIDMLEIADAFYDAWGTHAPRRLRIRRRKS